MGDGGGIVISNAQIVGIAVFVVATLTALLKIIQSQYVSHCATLMKSWEQRFEEQKAADRQRIQDIQNAHAVTTGRLDARIQWLEARDADWREQQQNYIATLEASVEVQQKQTDALTALAGDLRSAQAQIPQVPATRRRAQGSGT